ncbi:hypothetical protein Tco_0378211 [Tanacetum coccineum]
MEQYLALTRGNQAPGMVKPKIGGNVNFEIKSKFMRELRGGYLVSHDAVMLRVFPINLTGVTKRWVDRLPLGTVDSWDLHKKAFIQSHQKVNIFYNGLGTMNRQLLDSQGSIPGMKHAQALTAIQTMVDHSQKWHDGSSNRNIEGSSNSEGIAGAYLDKDCPFNEEVKSIKEVTAVTIVKDVPADFRPPVFTSSWEMKLAGCKAKMSTKPASTSLSTKIADMAALHNRNLLCSSWDEYAIRKVFANSVGFVRYTFQLVDFDDIELTNNMYMIDVSDYVANVKRTTYMKSGSKTLDFYLATKDKLYLSSTSSTVIYDNDDISSLQELRSMTRLHNTRLFKLVLHAYHFYQYGILVEPNKEMMMVDSSQPREGTVKNLLLWARNHKNNRKVVGGGNIPLVGGRRNTGRECFTANGRKVPIA